jgi:hypothetical protein
MSGKEMDMTRIGYYALMLAALLALGGCTTAGTNTTSGTGGESGPWPTPPTQPSSSRPANDDTPSASLLVVLRAAAPEETQLRLAVTQIEFKVVEKNVDRWVTVAKREDIAKHESDTHLFSAKGGTALLASVQVPRRKYVMARVTLDDGKSALIKEKKESKLDVKLPLFSLAEWTPDEKAANQLTLAVNSAKLEKATEKTPATLPTEAFTLTPGVASGAVTGKVLPPMPNARVEFFWGTSKTALRAVAPAADGTFSVNDLPDGKYRIDVRANGFKLKEPLKEPVTVTPGKPLALDPLELVQAPTTAT